MTHSATMREWRAAEAPVTSLLFLTSLLITSSLAVSVVIVSPPGDMKVFQGSALSMICEVTDLSASDVSNGQLIWGRINAAIETMTSDGIDYIISNDTYKQRVVSNLTVTNVTYGDEAMYYCSWRQSSQTTDYLNIKVVGRPSITSLELDGEPIAGRKLVITCTVEGKPLPSIEWIGPLQTTSSSLPSSHSSTQARLNNHTTVGRLVLRNLTWDDTGSYRCSAENAHGAMIRTSLVNFAPWASISNSSQVNRHVSSEAIVTSLQPMVLYCMAYNILHTDNLQMEWSFLAEGEQTFISLHDDPRMDIVRLPDVPLDDTYRYYYVTSSISFHADFVDQGTFRCDVFRGNNVLADEERQVFLQDIPRVTLLPDTVGVAIGDDVDVTCRVEAIPPVTSAAWMLNYHVKLPSTRTDVNSYTVDLVYRLQVTSDLDYLNLRTCRASNSEGFVSEDLVIEEKDDCDNSQCTGEHEYCMDIGDSYYCLCDTGYYRESNGLCVAYSTTPSPTRPTTPSPSSTSTTTPASHHTRSTTEEGGDSEQTDSKQVGLYAGIGAGVVVVVIIIIIVIVCVVMRRRKQNLGTERFDLKPADTPVPSAPPVASSTYYSNTVFSPFTDPHEYTPLKIDRSEFPREQLQLQDKLGQGKFGTVVRALALSLFQNGKWDTVAVKTHRETATDAEKSEFLRELSLLRSLPRHQHVVAFVGCCTLSDPTYIIMEYCANGDLLSYLRRRRPDRGMFVGHMTYDLTARDFFSFALHVARGMAHVASHKIVHRDVAARNVLMSERNVCKVSDFGLARRVDDNSDVYEIVSRRPLPLRWMSPESLRDGVHTSQSDVWSYGVLLWELVTLGASPYPGNTGKAVIELVTSGTRPVIPPQCRGELADIMTSCWAMNPAQRPTFDVITLRFEKLLEQEGDYLQLDNIQEGIYSILEPSVSGERV